MFTAVRNAYAIDTGEDDDELQRLLAVDSTCVSAHQHAAGARADGTLTGGRSE